MIKLNGTIVEFGKFPNGEIFLKKEIKQSSSYYVITWNYESNSDFIELFLLKSYLDESVSRDDTHLVINYMPFSRMDRDNYTYIFTLKYISNFINSMNFKTISVLESHSDVTPALLNNCYSISRTKENVIKIIHNILKDSMDDFHVYYPDAGAQKRYESMFPMAKSIVGFKQRDFESGNIKSLDIIGDFTNPNKVIIIDDLCSKGGTFMLSASKLKELGFKEIYLYITHCENTIYDGDILKTDLIDHVYTTDSIFTAYNEQKTDKITVFKL